MNARLLMPQIAVLQFVSLGPILLATAPPVCKAQASFTSLGDLPGGPFESRANAISPDGTVIVGSGRTDDGWRAFRWAEGAMTELVGLPTEDFEGSEAFGTTAEGEVVVGNLLGFDSVMRAFIWNDGQVSYINPEDVGTHSVRASAVSCDGTVIVGTASSPGYEAYLWNQGKVTHMGWLGSRMESYAKDVSRDGSSVIGISRTGSTYKGFLWIDGMFRTLEGPQDSVLGTRAIAISADGQTVVGVGGVVGAGSSRIGAVRWEDGDPSQIPPVRGTLGTCSAEGVSATGGVVVGWCSLGFPFGAAATVWDRWIGTRKIAEVLEQDFGLELNGFTVFAATDVSDDGTTIVGYGINRDGWQEAWMARIPLTLPVRVDILPNQCPNRLNVRSHGSVKVVIAGSEALNLAHLDTASIELSRVDSPESGVVLPEIWWQGFTVRLRDVTSDSEAPCGCAYVDAVGDPGARSRAIPDRHRNETQVTGAGNRARDGYLDAELRFSLPDVVQQLNLGRLQYGDTVPLRFSARLDDGTSIAGSDCIVIQPVQRGHQRKR